MNPTSSEIKFPVVHTPCRKSSTGIARCVDISWLTLNNLTAFDQTWAKLSEKYWLGGCSKIPAEVTPLAKRLKSEGISYVFSTWTSSRLK